MASTRRRCRRVRCPPLCGLSSKEEFMLTKRAIRWSRAILPSFLLFGASGIRAWQAAAPAAPTAAQIAAQEDRQKMLDLLHISSLRNALDTPNPHDPTKTTHDK